MDNNMEADYFIEMMTNSQVESVFNDAVGFEFKDLSHHIDISYDGKQLHIDFTDLSDTDKQRVINFVENIVSKMRNGS